MVEYSKIVYLDSDLFLPNGHLDLLFAMYEGSPKPVARKLRTTYNAGFMVLRPNMSLYFDMLTKFNTIQSNDGGDQDFQVAYFQKHQQGIESFTDRSFPIQVSNLDRLDHSQTPAKRPNPPKRVHIYHPFGVKPWMCPKMQPYCQESAERANRYLWPQFVDLWWQHFDEMVKAWPWIAETGGGKEFCLQPKLRFNYTITKEALKKERLKGHG